MANLKEKYNQELRPALKEELGLSNIMAVPKLTKVVINMGVGEAANDKKHLESALDNLTVISGQKPVVTRARQSVASFKIREGWPLGCKVTLRGNKMYDFVERSQFDRLGIFTYSHEEGTSAHKLEDDVPEQVKRSRSNKIMALQQKISTQKNKNKVGKTVKVLIDRVDANNYYGRTEQDSPEVDNEVIIPSKEMHLRVGDFYDVKITDSKEYDLIGKVD